MLIVYSYVTTSFIQYTRYLSTIYYYVPTRVHTYSCVWHVWRISWGWCRVGRALYFSDLTADLRSLPAIRRGTEFSILTRTPARWLAIRWGVTAKYISNRKRANRLTSRWRISYGVRFITPLSWRIERNYRATIIPPPRVCNPLGAISHSPRSFLRRILYIFLHQ